jgi:hypothetical protein
LFELVRVAGRSGVTITLLERGAEDTTARAWAAGAIVAAVLTNEGLVTYVDERVVALAPAGFRFEHEQLAAASTWTVTHNLDGHPAVTVVDSAGTVVDGVQRQSLLQLRRQRMARKFLTPIDLVQNELQNAVVQLLASDPGGPVQGQIWYNSTSKTLKFYTGTVTIVLGRLDQLNAPTGSVGLNSQKITGLADGTAATDAATVGQVTAATAGLDVKQSVRAATTANGTLASAFANGQTIDGVALVTGDRILLKNQTTGAENGIYTVNASGAPTRATDADANAEVTSGMFLFVEEGTSNADTGWVLTTNGAIVVGTTALTFAKFSAAPTVVAKFAASVGDGSATSFAVTHGLGSTDVAVEVFTVSGGARVEPDITHTDANNVTIAFSVAPSSNQYRVVVIG